MDLDSKPAIPVCNGSLVSAPSIKSIPIAIGSVNLEKYSGYSAATTQTTFAERETLDDKKQEIEVLDDENDEEEQIQPPKGQKKTYSTGDGGGYSM